MANKLAERIKYAMDHLSPKQHISMLARPNWRRVQWKNVHASAKPYSVRRTALKARPTTRIKVMARPKYLTEKYEPMGPPTFIRIDPKIVERRISRRNNDLALPKKRSLLANMVFPAMSHNIAEYLWKVQNSQYRKFRYFCNARRQRELRKKQKIMAKLRRAIKPEEWDQHMRVMSELAIPKEYPKPRFPFKRKKWRPVNMRRIEELSTPPSRDLPPPRDPLIVPPQALTYQITERLDQISKPKAVPEFPPIRMPGTVSPAALKAVASPRTINLAKPAERPEGIETDLRKDAFTVSPTALKAKCSRRLKALARPKIR